MEDQAISVPSQRLNYKSATTLCMLQGLHIELLNTEIIQMGDNLGKIMEITSEEISSSNNNNSSSTRNLINISNSNLNNTNNSLNISSTETAMEANHHTQASLTPQTGLLFHLLLKL